jgi:aspartate carbamoyltransferase
MLCGYTALPSVFIIRSKIEGVCRSLQDAMQEYSMRSNIVMPCFVNAGDGKHEHPTQEFLDEFSFIDQLDGKTDSIHIALVGDLLLGRTIHSKADGLRIFNKVTVDLVAPTELQLPHDYVSKMKSNGFNLNTFSSLDEYMSSGKTVAPILYFTRLQLERMDKSMLEKEAALRSATSLRMDMLTKLPKGAKIYHPLPRHGEFPEIPFEVDKTEFNGYDEQSRNGYYVRTALLGLLTGAFEDIHAHHPQPTLPQKTLSFKVTPVDEANKFFKAAAESTSEPTAWVELEFPPGTCPSQVRKCISRMRALSGIETMDGFCQITGSKGFHTVPADFVNRECWLEYFFSFFADCNPRVVFERSKSEFMQLTAEGSADTLSALPGLSCKNSACVSHPDSKQRDVSAIFHASRISANRFTCRYCEREYSGQELFM